MLLILRSRHVDVKVHYIRGLLRDGHVKTCQMCRYSECFGYCDLTPKTLNFARPASQKHKEYAVCGYGVCGVSCMWGMLPARYPFALISFCSTVQVNVETKPLSWPIPSKLSKFISSSNLSRKTRRAGGSR